MLVQNNCKRESFYTTTRFRFCRYHGSWGRMASRPRQSPTGWVLGRPVYPAVHGLGGWRSWNQPRSAPRLGVKKRPPRVRSHGLQGRIACNGREKLSWPMWDPSRKARRRDQRLGHPGGTFACLLQATRNLPKKTRLVRIPVPLLATLFLSSTICQKILLALRPLWTQNLVNCYQALRTLA